MSEANWINAAAVDQTALYEGNTVLCGGQSPRGEK